ncbi:PH domain-containing protein [Massilia sp. TS11]|uniref:PH domain-containing protein n=1 Tax=Massilia sp. TS11 TaxID=2908003 RepID=UPI001EDBA72A|nr:PH domain-containing protein [Massilia sp. TS11]MCG2586482.1 PH domain-containing protein [Massilia sp. TS11]
MSSYVRAVLLPSESVIHEAETSLWSQFVLLLLGVLTLPLGIGFLPMFVIPLACFLAVWIKVSSTELAITDRRVIAKFGFISRKTIELNINKIESLQVDQSLLGRIFNFGSLVLSGAGNPQAPIPGIANPLEFRRKFMEAQETANKVRAA